MKKTFAKYILALIVMVVAMPIVALAADNGYVQKSAVKHRVDISAAKVQKADPRAVKFAPAMPTRKYDRSVNSLIAQSRRAVSPRAQFHAPALTSAVATSAPLMGSVLYCDGITKNFIGTLPTDGSGVVTSNFQTEISAANGGVAIDGKYYCTEFDQLYRFIYHAVYDIETGEQLIFTLGSTYSEIAFDLTLDPVSGKVYGCFFNEDGDGYIFGEMDPATFTTIPISDLDAIWAACACDAQGRLYAIDMNGVLYSVDKTNGVMTEIGFTGIFPHYATSAIIDPVTGVMFWTVSPADECGYLYTVDTATAEAEMVCRFDKNDEIAGLFFLTPEAADGAPGAVTDLAANFDDGSTFGAITFKAPTKLFDGSDPADNALTYTITANGTIVGHDTARYGEAIDAPVIVDTDGEYTFTVYVSNAVGNGPKSEITIYVGQDTPKAPSNVKADYAEGAVTVIWDAVTQGINNGYIGAVSYNIERIANGDTTAVATKLTECTYKETIAEPSALTTYRYAVKAVAGGKESSAGISNAITLGSIEPPYSIDFTAADNLDGFTIIDANNDGRAWYLFGYFGARVSFNSSQKMDDWLVTPPVMLEKGKIYTFTFVAAAQSNTFPERVEAGFGSEATAEALSSNIIIDPTIVGEKDTEFTATVLPEADGTYYFGIHGCSDMDMFYLNVRSLGISSGVAGKGPVAPTDLVVIPAADGANTAEVSFTVPDRDVNGDAISELVCATIYANGDKVAEISNPAPGVRITETINVPTFGTYTIEVSATNAQGEGVKASAKAYIGVNIAAAPTDVKAVEIGNTGRVTVSWTAPTADRDGNPINPALITYKVVNYDNDVLAEGITGTSAEVTAWTGQGQTFDYFDVTAVTDAGESLPGSSPMIAIGAPYTMPVYEGFTDGDFDCGLGAIDYGAEWYVFDLETLGSIFSWMANVKDPDANNGLALMYGTSLFDSADLFTGKIEVTGKTPVLSFWYYTMAFDDENTLDIYIRDSEGNMDYKGQYVMADGEEGGWTEVQIPLDQYVGKTVQVYFRGTILAYSTLFVDAIKVYNLADYDLAVTGIETPAKVAPGQEFKVRVTIANEGAKSIDAYSVQLSHNGAVVASEDCGAISPRAKKVVEFTHSLTPVDAEENLFKATVVCTEDEVESNNSAEEPVALTTPYYPTATGLVATETSEGVVLDWEAPDLSEPYRRAVTEDFESYEPFTVEASPWTLVDVDRQQIGGFNGLELPVAACAYFVLNARSFNQTFQAHSGVQYMSTMYNNNGAKQSDWLISPELTGDAQTISLFARSYTSSYGLETMSIYYSTTDTDPESFELISTHPVPAEWTEYTADLPEGARYFAIVCESKDVFMLFVDDVTYLAADSPVIDLDIAGYNIYRNGVLVNDTPVTDTTYADSEAHGECEYVVTVVYTVGESAPSNAASVNAGVGTVVTGIDIKVEGRTIIVTGADGPVALYTVDGKAVDCRQGASRHEIAVSPGIYIVKADTRISKVIVR